MKVETQLLTLNDRASSIKTALHAGARLGVVTSIDGRQLVTLLLWPDKRTVQCFETPVEDSSYSSLTPVIPQAHWFERTAWDMFGLLPHGHPRLKRTHLHEVYAFASPPLAREPRETDDHHYSFLDVEGEGIYEIPVGPIHAGIIEPGHFRFSCSGEIILNLEIRLGYVHRGVEKRLTEVPLRKARFVAEAAASDMPIANALAHATAIESVTEIELSALARSLRTVALEVERVAMHISDLGGLAGDIGYLAISSSMARLRGLALRMGELLSGNRLMRGYVCPGGVTRGATVESLTELKTLVTELKSKLARVIEFFFDNQVLADRMDGIGKVSHGLAMDFGLVGIAARAAGVEYDCRKSWSHELYPDDRLEIVVETTGDVLARAKVRVREIAASLHFLEQVLPEIDASARLSSVLSLTCLPPNSVSAGIVESHRGELIHLILTDHVGGIQRYCIKDPSVNNWTALAIAVRNNLVADFPLCNKSFSLSYSGHDL